MLFKKNGSSPAIMLNGQFSNNTINVPVVLSIDGPLEIKTEVKDVTIDQNTSFVALTEMNLAAYTADVTESMWMNAEQTNGVIVVSSDENEDIYWRIVANLKGWKHHCHFWHH